MAQANVYVDGFNLYYGALRTRFRDCKWLDPRRLAEELFPEEKVGRVRYFTARVRALPNDPGQPQRQDAYLRALRANGIEPHEGRFKTEPKWMPLKDPCAVPGCTSPVGAVVRKTEEKGSDVALGAYLLRDAHAGEMDTAIVVTNDSDLETPIRLARDEAGIRILLVSPDKTAQRSLEAHADVVRKLKRRKPLAAAQFPAEVSDPSGMAIHRPPSWH